MNALVETAGERVHGALAAGHLFALWWNRRRGNMFAALVHAGFFAFELWSMHEHTKELERG